MKDHLPTVAALFALIGMLISGAMWIQAVASRVDAQEKRFDEMRTEQVNRLQDEVKQLRNDMQWSRVEILKWMAEHTGRR